MSTALLIVGDADPTVPDTTPPGKPMAWVSPGSGSDSNNGTYPDTPYATIGKAISEGYRTINVDAGTHNVSSINARVTLIMYPGTHTFSNAPVTSTVPFNMIAAHTRSPDHRYVGEGSAYISYPSCTDGFRIQDGTNDLQGGMFESLSFNKDSCSRSAIYTKNVSGMVLRNNKFAQDNKAASNNKTFIYADSDSGHEVRDWVLDNNSVSRRAYARLRGSGTFHNWVWANGAGVGGKYPPQDEAWVDATVDCYGFHWSGDSFECGTTQDPPDTTPAGHGYFHDIVQQSRMYELYAEGMHSTNSKVKLRCDDARSSFFHTDRGVWAISGEFQINGVVQDTDRDSIDSKYNRIVVQGRHSF